jgi:UDP-glucose 4-epimerase
MFTLVTGGAGFIGSHSVEHLLAAGGRVRVLDNLSSGKRANLAAHRQLEFIEGDIRDAQAVAAALAGGVTHVLHLAAQVSVATSVEQPLESASHNLTGFLNVLDGARRAGVTKMVYASSAAVYGTPARLPLTEASPVAPLSPYGLEKSVNDQYARLYESLYGFAAMGMRFFNVYGPRQDPKSPYSGVISIFSDRIRRGEPLTVNGDGGQTRDFVYVGDVARANLAALGSPLTGVCNVATGKTVTLLELIAALGAAADKQAEVRFGPERSGDIRDSSADPKRMHDELGITNTTALADGLRKLLESLA